MSSTWSLESLSSILIQSEGPAVRPVREDTLDRREVGTREEEQVMGQPMVGQSHKRPDGVVCDLYMYGVMRNGLNQATIHEWSH